MEVCTYRQGLRPGTQDFYIFFDRRSAKLNYLSMTFETSSAMKIKRFFSLAFILITGVCFSQKYVTQIKSAETHKWGYANEKGQIIIAAQYDRCNEFTSDGLASAFDDKRRLFNFINLKGEK